MAAELQDWSALLEGKNLSSFTSKPCLPPGFRKSRGVAKGMESTLRKPALWCPRPCSLWGAALLGVWRRGQISGYTVLTAHFKEA